mgnify:CR=1 FL=1
MKLQILLERKARKKSEQYDDINNMSGERMYIPMIRRQKLTIMIMAILLAQLKGIGKKEK